MHACFGFRVGATAIPGWCHPAFCLPSCLSLFRLGARDVTFGHTFGHVVTHLLPRVEEQGIGIYFHVDLLYDERTCLAFATRLSRVSCCFVPPPPLFFPYLFP